MNQPAEETGRDAAEKVVVLDELPQDSPATATKTAPEAGIEPTSELQLEPKTELEPIDVKSFM